MIDPSFRHRPKLRLAPDRCARTMLAALAVALPAFAAAAHAQDLPDGIAARGKTEVLRLHAEGVQVYECKAGSSGGTTWQLREPLATLMQGKMTVGRHFDGPTWQLADRSAVVGKVVAKAPGKTKADVAWLRLEVVDHKGKGALSKVTTVQRIETKGGAFSGHCDRAGAFHLEPYSAEYVFLS